MEKSTIIECVKMAVGTVAGIGISMITSAFAGHISGTAGNNNPVKKVCMAFGGAVLGSMIGSYAEDYICDEIDNIVGTVGQIGDIVKSIQEGD